MKRRVFLCLALTALAGGGVFAQTHFVSAEATFLGGGARYEYVLNPYFTLGGYVTYSYLPTPFLDDDFCIDISTFAVGIAARWYPTGRKFFTELGMGYGSGTMTDLDSSSGLPEKAAVSGFTIIPGFGWTLDLGSPGGFFISPGIRIPLLFFENNKDVEIGEGIYPFFSIIAFFGIGYAF